MSLAVALAVCAAASAAVPVMDIPDAVAQGALQDTHRKQIDTYVAYHIAKMASATTQEAVIAARGKLKGAYIQYGKAREYMSAYAASVATHGKDMLAKLAPDDSLKALKEVNLSIRASRMPQVSLQGLVVEMVGHENPAVRFFGWQTYALMQTAVMAAGNQVAQPMYAALANAMEKETDPHVLAEMLKMFRLSRGSDDDTAISPEAHRQGRLKLFNILKAHWVGLCRRVLQADGIVVEGASTGIVAVVKFKSALDKEVTDKVAIQLVANMTWSAGKAYDLALRVREAARAAVLAKKESERAAADPSQENLTAAKLAGQNARQLAAKVGKDPKELASQAPQSNYAVSTCRLLLTECEKALNKLTGSNKSYISKPLKSHGKDPAAGVRLGVIKWVDDLLDNGIRRPEEEVPPKEPPAIK